MTQPIKGIVVCVGYDDLLTLTLPRNLKHLSSCLVVTSKTDQRTRDLVKSVGCELYQTDAFTRHGARFNKGLALEEGFDVLGRSGWIMVWDADVILPSPTLAPMGDLQVGKLYSARRHILTEPKQWSEHLNWSKVHIHNDKLFPGYFHLFNADDPVLVQRPWYDVTFSHAGGGDGYFQSRWKPEDKIRFPWNVMHLGPIDTNWHGRATDRTDGQPVDGQQESKAMQDVYVRAKGWVRGGIRRPVQEHVEVPGYLPTDFKVGGT